MLDAHGETERDNYQQLMRMGIQLHIGNTDLKKQAFFFRGTTFKDFNLWFYDSIESYKTTIRDLLDKITEWGL